MIKRLSWIMAFGGGVWGIVLSLTWLIKLNLDAYPFMFLLLLLHLITITVALWRKVKPLWRAIVWLSVGGLLAYFVYLSRFSIGAFLIPTAGLILTAGILEVVGKNMGVLWNVMKEHSSQKLSEAKSTLSSDGEIDPRLCGLTQRELEVLVLIAKGRSNKEIANVLVISLNTVRHHVHQILQKLDCASRAEAASIAIASGLLSANNHPESDQSSHNTD